MKIVMRKIIFLVVITFGFVGTVVVSAAELPRGMVIGDNEGIAVNKDGEYFIDIPNAKPGEVYKKEITLRSTTEKEPFDLSIRVHPKESKGVIDWNEHVTMTLTLDGKEIYKGPMLGDGKRDWSKENLSLGTFGFGTDKVLEATFEIDKNLTTEEFKEENLFLFSWEFIATRTSESGGSESSGSTEAGGKKPWGKLPSTGEEWRQMMYQVLAGLLLLLIFLLLWKRRKQEKQKEEADK